MKSIVEIRKEIKTRTDKMAEIFGGAELETRQLNADEAKAFDKLRGEVDGLKADLEHEERRLALGKPDAKPVTGVRRSRGARTCLERGSLGAAGCDRRIAARLSGQQHHPYV